MRAIDTGLLAFAANRFAPEHARASAVLEQMVNGETPWALPWSVADAFLRVVTHPHAVVRPLQTRDARGFLDAVLASPAVRAIGPTERHAAMVDEVLGLLPPSAGLPAGFELAVILREHGVRELFSGDPAMRAYPFLSVRDPLKGADGSAWDRPTRRYRVLAPRRLPAGRGGA